MSAVATLLLFETAWRSLHPGGKATFPNILQQCSDNGASWLSGTPFVVLLALQLFEKPPGRRKPVPQLSMSWWCAQRRLIHVAKYLQELLVLPPDKSPFAYKARVTGSVSDTQTGGGGGCHA